MRWMLIALLTCLCTLPPAIAEAPPADALHHPIKPAWHPSTQPVDVPFKLTDTNHLLIRLKINGKGPFNFIVDTGSPAMILRVPVAKMLGLKADAHKVAYLDQLDIEGGAELRHVMCIVDTPYQIEGMNAIGASGVELDGLLGYSVLARFRLQIDMSKDHMVWTPIAFNPPPIVRTRGGLLARGNPTTRPIAHATTRPAAKDLRDVKEEHLEMAGGILKLLGPLIKTDPIIPKQRGFIGIELAVSSDSVLVQQVLGGSPADRAGVMAGDRLFSVNGHAVNSITAVQEATARVLPGEKVAISLRRGATPLNLNITAGEGL